MLANTSKNAGLMPGLRLRLKLRRDKQGRAVQGGKALGTPTREEMVAGGPARSELL